MVSDASTLLVLSGVHSNAATGRHRFAKKKPSSCCNTQLISIRLSLQGWERLVVGAFNCTAHWRTTGRRGLQGHGGNAPPTRLRGAPGDDKGGVGPAGETRKHLQQHMRHRLPLTGSTQGVPHPLGEFAAGILCHIKAI